MTLHQCEWCQKTKGRRALQALLSRFPNMTSTKAATQVEITRPHVSAMRNEMEARGCVPRRTVTGNAQGHVERQLAKAQTTGGVPIGATQDFDAAHAAEHFGLSRVVAWPTAGRVVIGSVCYPGMRAA